ncbi:hypothetical protein M8J77_014976 [Diaphorina citri]|nr:hypothetical protein M8J77_014976 [Diaphorina citri]
MVDCGSGRASQFNMARARDPSPRCIADTKRHLFFILLSPFGESYNNNNNFIPNTAQPCNSTTPPQHSHFCYFRSLFSACPCSSPIKWSGCSCLQGSMKVQAIINQSTISITPEF